MTSMCHGKRVNDCNGKGIKDDTGFGCRVSPIIGLSVYGWMLVKCLCLESLYAACGLGGGSDSHDLASLHPNQWIAHESLMHYVQMVQAL